MEEVASVADMEDCQEVVVVTVQREVRWREGRQEQDLGKYPTYPSSIVLQTHGRLNTNEYTSCQGNSGPFTTCVSFGQADAVGDNKERILFNGLCTNCFWGSQAL